MQHTRDWYTTQYGDGNYANFKIAEEVVDHFDAAHDDNWWQIDDVRLTAPPTVDPHYLLARHPLFLHPARFSQPNHHTQGP